MFTFALVNENEGIKSQSYTLSTTRRYQSIQ